MKDLDLVVSGKIVLCFHYMSVSVKGEFSWKCHTHALQTNPWQREKESKNNDSIINSVTSRMMPFGPQDHNFNKFGRVLLGDATYQISNFWYLTRSCFDMFSIYAIFIKY